MFIGEYSHTIDEKGRMQVPVKFRGQLAGGAVVTKGEDGCLALYPKSAWEELAEKIAKLPTLSRSDARAFARKKFSGAMDVEIDRQGRVNLPAGLRAFGSLKGSAVVTGQYDHVEVWDPAAWSDYSQKIDTAEESLSGELGELGI